MDNHNLKKAIQELWNSQFQEGVNWSSSEMRELTSGQNGYRFLVFFNDSKRRYYETGQAQKDIQGSKSPFGRILGLDDNLKYKHLVIRPSKTPVTRGHCMFIADSLRPRFKSEDLQALMEIASLTDYTLFVNLRGSGATVPTHFHAQGHLIKFPVTDERTGARQELFYSSPRFQLSKLIYPSYGVSVETSDLEKQERLGKRLEDLQGDIPFNLLVPKRKVLVYPRPKEKPDCFEEWTMGGFEMGGAFCTRDEKMFRELDYKTAETALRDATYQDRTQQERFEKIIQEALDG